MSRQRVIYGKEGNVYLKDGKEVTREQFIDNSKLLEIIESGKSPGGMPSNGYPFYSTAAGVGHENKSEAEKICRKAGFPTEFNSDGDPKFTSRLHRKKFCEQFELYDRNAGDGDATPKCKASTSGKKKKSFLPSSVTG